MPYIEAHFVDIVYSPKMSRFSVLRDRLAVDLRSIPYISGLSPR